MQEELMHEIRIGSNFRHIVFICHPQYWTSEWEMEAWVRVLHQSCCSPSLEGGRCGSLVARMTRGGVATGILPPMDHTRFLRSRRAGDRCGPRFPEVQTERGVCLCRVR